jgi:hypothetical protein
MASYKTWAIIELLALIAIIGALIIYLISSGSSVGNVSFITGK